MLRTRCKYYYIYRHVHNRSPYPYIQTSKYIIKNDIVSTCVKKQDFLFNARFSFKCKINLRVQRTTKLGSFWTTNRETRAQILQAGQVSLLQPNKSNLRKESICLGLMVPEEYSTSCMAGKTWSQARETW